MACQPCERIRLFKHSASGAIPLFDCSICENDFEAQGLRYCAACQQPSCSLCGALESQCANSCKLHGRISQQIIDFLSLFESINTTKIVRSLLGQFIALVSIVNLLNGVLLTLIYQYMQPANAIAEAILTQTLISVFVSLLIISVVLCWVLLLANHSRRIAQQESHNQTQKLTLEIQAHHKTDTALQEAKELAERSNAAKSRYLTGISHELRTPLQSILGYAQLLLADQQVGSAQHKGLKIIYRNGQYLTDLIEGLLDVSKIEAGRLDLYRTQVRFSELIAQIVDMFNMQALAKGLNFHYKALSPLPETVICDEKRLRQILNNILSNAVKYTQRGQINFTVRYRNQVAEFIVLDTGIGIDDESIERIFKPFERVRDSKSANLPGTGLGLTIVKLLTEIMGGEVKVTSTLGEGSRFKVSLMLPWISQDADIDRSKALAETAQYTAKIAGYEGYQRTVLLVDDDPIVRGLFSDLLIPIGFRVLEAQNGEKCLQLVEQTNVDFILLDINMPLMNGLQAAQTLRADKFKPPIVMLSADVQEQQGASLQKQLHNDYLIKPVSNEKLLMVIAKHLKLKWIYQQPNKQASTSATGYSGFDSETKKAASLVVQQVPTLVPEPLDHPLIKELIACAQMGYLKGANDALLNITQQSILSAPLCAQLQTLCNQFQFEVLIQTLEDSGSEA